MPENVVGRPFASVTGSVLCVRWLYEEARRWLDGGLGKECFLCTFPSDEIGVLQG